MAFLTTRHTPHTLLLFVNVSFFMTVFSFPLGTYLGAVFLESMFHLKIMFYLQYISIMVSLLSTPPSLLLPFLSLRYITYSVYIQKEAGLQEETTKAGKAYYKIRQKPLHRGRTSQLSRRKRLPRMSKRVRSTSVLIISSIKNTKL